MTRTNSICLISIAYIFAATLGEWLNLANAAPPDTPFFSVDATVLPAARYLLTAPSEAEVLHAPVAGSVHFPEPDLPDEPQLAVLEKRWQSATGDPNAVAILKYPDAVFEKIELKRERWELYNRYLADYGLSGVVTPAFNQPWNSEADAGKRAAELEAADILKLDDTSEAADTSTDSVDYTTAKLEKLRATLQALPKDAPFPAEIATLTRTIEAKSNTAAKLNEAQLREILEKAIVYDLRESLGLNSKLITFGLAETLVMLPPNYFRAALNLTFVVERTHQEYDVDSRNLDNFLDYWKVVVAKNLYNNDDIDFLKNLTSVASRK